MHFQFNQPEKTKDCGYRCLYYAINELKEKLAPYEQWLENFRFFFPIKTGIFFSDICSILEYYGMDRKFTVPRQDGLFLIWSGVGAWCKSHGHYLIYHDGVVYDSLKSEPYEMSLSGLLSKLESRTVDGSFKCMEIV